MTMFRIKKTHPGCMPRMTRFVTLVAMLTFMTVGTAAAASKVSFAVPPWPGEAVKAEIATHILDKAGYRTSTTNLSGIVAMKGVAMGEIDVDMAVWHPINDSVVNPMLESGKVVELVTNVADAKYSMTVPDYVWDAGVHSIADLHKHADKFDHRIYGIEPGNDGNTLVQAAIKKNQYDLGEFKLIPSSSAGMMSQVKYAIRQHKWIVFLGWKPHWMNVVFDIKYLDDPEVMWGGDSRVVTIARPEFVEKHPNVARFLKQMVIPAKVQSQWIYDYGYEDQPLDKVAGDWIKANPELVEKWLDGVTTADGGRSALDALHDSLDD